MLADLKLSGSAVAWGVNGFVAAISNIADAGYDGVECSSALVSKYEDRLHVFEEMLDISGVKLSSMLQYADFFNRETADEEVEHIANTARFLSANNSPCLLVSPSNLNQTDLDDDDWTTFVAILEEMGSRCQEFGITLAYRPRAGYAGGSDREIKKIISMIDSKLIYLCLDTAELSLSNISLERFFKTYGNRIIYIRFRDVSGSKRRALFTSNKPGTAPQFGRGAVDFTKAGKIIEKYGYSGWVSVETAGESHLPKTAIEDAFRYVIKKSGIFV